MKRIFLALILPLLCSISFGQNQADAEKFVNEGVACHDKGQYDMAISKYDQALALDKDNLLALMEKALTLLSLKKYDESINYCQKAISTHPGDRLLKTLYVTYGNAYDGLNKGEKSLEIYDQGITVFPDYYQLYFNKGITLTNQKRYEDAMQCFEKAVLLNPKHASSHNAIARLSSIKNRKIPSLLAYCRFLSIEPGSDRARENLAGLQKIMKGNVKETGDKSVTINIDPNVLDDTEKKGKQKENNFGATDLILSMDAAMDLDKKNIGKKEVEQFYRKFQTVCGSLKETRNNNYGFFWDYYVPYFTEMKDRNFVETFSYIVFASSNDPAIAQWLKNNKARVDKFFEWSEAFEWKQTS